MTNARSAKRWMGTLWLAAFIRGTGSWLPPGVTAPLRLTEGQERAWDRSKEEKLGDLLIDKTLAQEGSRGPSRKPPEPTAEE